VREPWADVPAGVPATERWTAAEQGRSAVPLPHQVPPVREPWAGHAFEAAPLTSAQRAVLAGLEDQPAGPRLDGVAADLPALADQPTPAVLDAEPDEDGADPAAREPIAAGDPAEASELAADQPTIPRLRAAHRGVGPAPGGSAGAPGGGPGRRTGSVPGDADAADPDTRSRWTEQEQEG
jgi:hypothetical protein